MEIALQGLNHISRHHQDITKNIPGFSISNTNSINRGFLSLQKGKCSATGSLSLSFTAPGGTGSSFGPKGKLRVHFHASVRRSELH